VGGSFDDGRVWGVVVLAWVAGTLGGCAVRRLVVGSADGLLAVLEANVVKPAVLSPDAVTLCCPDFPCPPADASARLAWALPSDKLAAAPAMAWIPVVPGSLLDIVAGLLACRFASSCREGSGLAEDESEVWEFSTLSEVGAGWRIKLAGSFTEFSGLEAGEANAEARGDPFSDNLTLTSALAKFPSRPENSARSRSPLVGPEVKDWLVSAPCGGACPTLPEGGVALEAG
jgi:hypothetical protein